MFRKSSLLLSFVLLLGVIASSVFAIDYHIDPVGGNDTTGDGSLGNPWESFKNIQYYYSGPDYPPGWVQLQPGETIYLMDGVHDTLINSGGGYPDMIALFRFFNGNTDNWFHIKAYPGHNPILDAGGTARGITLSSCSYWEVEGFELRNCAERGIDLEGMNPGKIHDIQIHDVDGDSRDNVCALELNGCTDVEVYDCSFGDIIDSTCAANGTCWRGCMGIAIFAGATGADISVHDCYFYRTESVDYTVGGIMYKHSSKIPGSYFNVYNNTFTGLRTTSFQTGTPNTHFHHNLIVDTDTGLVKSQDFGGTTHQTNQTFEYNTFYNAPGFYFYPTLNWVNADFPGEPNNINFNNNIIYGTDVTKVEIHPYISDVLYYIVVDEYHANYNCYYNPNLIPHEFRIAASWNAQPDYSQGGVYNLSQWQSNFGWDIDSVVADPCFVDAANGDFHLQTGSPAAGMGIYGDVEEATNPNPVDNAVNVSVDADLSWSAGSGAISHNVYFGTNLNDVTNTVRLAGDVNGDGVVDWNDVQILGQQWLTDPFGLDPSGDLDGNNNTDVIDFSVVAADWRKQSDAIFKSNQTETTFDPGTLINEMTYYWRVDEVNANGTVTGAVWSFTVLTASLPGQASEPSPADSAIDVDVNADLSWTGDPDATSHDVYFGTNPTPSAGELLGNQPGATFDPGTMAYNTTYYWRIDEVNDNGTTTGVVWNFTTIALSLPSAASNPSPADSATNVSAYAELSWTAGVDAASRDVYFGIVSPGSSQGNQPATTFDPGTMADNTTYYWRIDEVNATGTTTGTVWSFTTALSSINRALNKPVTVDSIYSGSYPGSNAVDGDNSSVSSRWVSEGTAVDHWIEIDLQGSYSIHEVKFWTGFGGGYNSPPSDFSLQRWNGSSWVDIFTETGNTDAIYTRGFGSVSTSKVRLYVTDAGSDYFVRIYEIEIYGLPD